MAHQESPPSDAGCLEVNFPGCVKSFPSAYHGGHLSLSEVATLICSETIHVGSLSESEIHLWSPNCSEIVTPRVTGAGGVVWNDTSHVSYASPKIV